MMLTTVSLIVVVTFTAISAQSPRFFHDVDIKDGQVEGEAGGNLNIQTTLTTDALQKGIHGVGTFLKDSLNVGSNLAAAVGNASIAGVNMVQNAASTVVALIPNVTIGAGVHGVVKGAANLIGTAHEGLKSGISSVLGSAHEGLKSGLSSALGTTKYEQEGQKDFPRDLGYPGYHHYPGLPYPGPPYPGLPYPPYPGYPPGYPYPSAYPPGPPYPGHPYPGYPPSNVVSSPGSVVVARSRRDLASQFDDESESDEDNRANDDGMDMNTLEEHIADPNRLNDYVRDEDQDEDEDGNNNVDDRHLYDQFADEPTFAEDRDADDGDGNNDVKDRYLYDQFADAPTFVEDQDEDDGDGNNDVKDRHLYDQFADEPTFVEDQVVSNMRGIAPDGNTGDNVHFPGNNGHGALGSALARILGLKPRNSAFQNLNESNWVKRLIMKVSPGVDIDVADISDNIGDSDLKKMLGFDATKLNDEFDQEPILFKVDTTKPDIPCPDVFSYNFDEILPGWSGHLMIPKFLSSRKYHIVVDMSLPVINGITNHRLKDLELIVFSSREEILNDDVLRCGVKFPTQIDVLPRLDAVSLNGIKICKSSARRSERLRMSGNVKIILARGVRTPTNYYFVPNEATMANKITSQRNVWGKLGNPFAKNGVRGNLVD